MLGRGPEALVALDEAMVHVTGGRVGPEVAGMAYCAVIAQCMDSYDFSRAQEWTQALTGWCDEQPGLVPYRGACLVHRAQILQLHGAWPAAIEITRGVAERMVRSTWPAIGPAHYCTAELFRLQGEFARAENEYREASRCGHTTEPGLALMRLSQGRREAAAANINRAVDEAAEPTQRARLLPAFVEIVLAVGNLEAAERASTELASLADQLAAPFLRACAAHASGSVRLARGDARSGLSALRSAFTEWQQLDAPYEAARTRELIARACRAVGDNDHARLELDAAAWTFRKLGAATDLARVASELRSITDAPGDGLTQREIQVLRLVAAGKSNRLIATELVLSEKTVARHMSNIFTKLGISSRAAATAYAYEHALV